MMSLIGRLTQVQNINSV